MTNVTNAGLNSVMNNEIPCEGTKAITYTADFSLSSNFVFDLTQQFNNKQFTSLQTIYVDNSANAANNLIVTIGTTGQTVTIPPKFVGYIPVIATNPPVISFTTAATGKVYIALLNFYVPGQSWLAA